MAGRKPRLYDTVTKQWIDFSSLLEADSFFKDTKKNPFVTTKEFGITSRYRYDEPLDNNELLGITLGGKPKSKTSTAAKIYKELNPKVDLESGLNAVGINPIWDRDHNFKKHPEWRPLNSPLYYPNLDEYWGYNDKGEYTNDIPENTIGSSARRRLLAESKDEKEEKRKWLSEYYNYLDGGFDAMSQEALDSYINNYANTNRKMLESNPDYNPKSPYVVKGRALTAVAGKKAIDRYFSDAEVPEDSDIRLLSGMSNTDLAKLSESNELISEIFLRMMDYYMLKYYGNVAKKYLDEPTNIGLDIEKHGEYAKLKQSIAKTTSEKVKKADSSWEKIGWGITGVLSSLGNSLVNNLGVLIRDIFSSDDIKNELRDRADNVINTISDRLVASQKYTEDIKNDAKEFDALASDKYAYYDYNGLKDKYSPEEKRALLYKFSILSQTVGEEKATLNLLKELQNRDYKEQGTIRRLGYTANNLLNTIGTTIGHIANMAWYAPQAAWDVALATTEAIGGLNFWDSLGDELYDTWNRSLDNSFVNYLSNVEHTGTWNPWDINVFGGLRSLEYYKQKGINANQILRTYGDDNTILHPSTLYDIVPVTGYMIGSASGAKGFNVVGNMMRSLSETSKIASIASKIGEVSSRGLSAYGYKAISRGTLLANKFLNGSAKFVDATAPAMATAGMDYGYAKNNYDDAMSKAESYIQSEEFEDIINDKINSSRESYLEGYNSISSSLSDKVAFALNNPDFRLAAYKLALLHNQEKSDKEDAWTILDAAKEMLLKPYKEEYLKEAEKIATFNAGLTFGLTILPDVHMTNTWRKAMFSALSRGAMNSLALNAFFKPIGKALGIKPKSLETYIEGITRKDGKWFINGKPMTRKDLINIYVDLSKAGFVSNYLQDVGVAAGNGLQESLLSLYIDLRFGEDATDGISYDMTEAWIAAADKAGLAFGDKVSFRDGLYGALAPWIISPARGVGDIYEGVKQAKLKGTKKFVWSLIEEPILKNSLLYNVTYGAKDIINKENLRRQMLHTTVETWLNANGSMYVDNIGRLLDLSKLELKAIELGDYSAFNDSRLGQMATAAIMLSLILNFLPIKSTMMAYMKDRANRKEVSLEDIDALNLSTLQLLALQEQGNLEEIENFLSQFNPSDRSILSDLIEIKKYNLDSKTKDARTEVLQLNDLKANALKTLDLIDKVGKYYLEADAKFGDSADLVVKQEYARLKLYLDELQLNIEDKTSALKKVELKIAQSNQLQDINSTVPVNDTYALFISQYKGEREKLLEGIEANKRLIRSFKDLLSNLKSERNKNRTTKPKDDLEAQALAALQLILDGIINYLENLIMVLLQKGVYLEKVKKEISSQEKDADTNISPLIVAKDIMNLSEEARYNLLTAKNLSKELQEEVNKFKHATEVANNSEINNSTSYVDLLKSKLSSINALRNLSYEGQLTPQAILRLNELVSLARMEQARDFYAKSFEGFANEDLYHVDINPNISVKELLNEDTGQIETVESVDESLPEIAVQISEDKAYLKFIKAYLEKVKELLAEEERVNLLLGLDKALRDAKNSLYTKMLENKKQLLKALKDLNVYMDPKLFTSEEMRELKNIIEFSTVYKSITADNIMQTITKLDDAFLQELSLFLKDRGFTPGDIKDIRERLLQYNHNITETILNNKKAEEERVRKKEEAPKVAEAKKLAAEKRLVSTINAVTSYTMAEQDVNMTPIRALLNALGIKDADSIKIYSNNLLKIFRQIVINSDGQTVLEMEKSLDENFKKITEDSEVLLLDKELVDLQLLLNFLKEEYHKKTGSFKTFDTANSSRGDTNSKESAESRLFNINSGTPYSFADLSWIDANPEYLKDNVMWLLLNDAHINDFLRTFTVTADTKIVFITAKAWAEKVESAINQKALDKVNKLNISEEEKEQKLSEFGYNQEESLPIIGAIKLQEFREGCITVENNGLTEYYLPLGLLPSTSKQSNTAILRGNAIKYKPNNSDPYIINQKVTKEETSNMEPLLTTITVKQRGVTLDLDAGPLPVRLSSDNVITAGNFCTTEDGNGAKTNLVPSINKKSTNRANWAVMLIQNMDATENAEGKTLEALQGEGVINFNSRTKEFAETLQSIVDLIQKNRSNLPGVLNSLNDIKSNSKTSINSRIEDEKIKVALASLISLANGYSYYIGQTKEGIKLAIINAKNKPIAQWTIFSDIQENIIGTDVIIKELAALKNEEDNNIAKWQVSWGNFNLDLKPSPLKVEYIRRAVSDRILYAFNVKTNFDIQITPVQDLFALLLIEVKNKEAEKRAAQQLIDNNINAATGLPNAGVDIDGAISIIQNSSIDGEIKDAKISMLLKIYSIKLKAELKLKGRKKLGINQSKARASTTGTTAIVNGKDSLKAQKASKKLVVSSIRGNVADKAVRDFFNPALKGQVTMEAFIEEFKDVFNKDTVANLWEALEQLNKTFIDNKWSIISTGIYTIEEELDDKVVGEIDLLAIDAMGNPHIIDIKTYSSEFSLIDNNHNYPAQVSMYRADMMRNINAVIPELNLHIYSLQIDSNENYYNMSTDSEGVNTIVKKPLYQSEIQIKKGARFEHHTVQYIGDTEVAAYRDKRIQNGIETALDVNTKDLMAEDTEVKNLEKEVKKDLNSIEEGKEDLLSPEELERLTAEAQAEALLSLNTEDWSVNRSTDELENLKCTGLQISE